MGLRFSKKKESPSERPPQPSSPRATEDAARLPRKTVSNVSWVNTDFNNSRTRPGSFLLVRSGNNEDGSVHGGGQTSVARETATMNGFFELPRGGYVVRTKSLGPIQFGIPPETIKDSLGRGLSVPQIFVIQGEMFDRKSGISKAEFEFPAYYCFFVAKIRVNIVTTKELEQRIRIALKETLMGPGAEADVSEDYPPNTSLDAFPNFQNEANSLDPSRKRTSLDDVVQFTIFDNYTQTAEIIAENGTIVKIRAIFLHDTIKSGMRQFFEVTEDKEILACVPAHVKLRAGGTVAQLLGTEQQRESTRSKYNQKQLAKKTYEDEERLHLETKPRASNMAGTFSGRPINSQEITLGKSILLEVENIAISHPGPSPKNANGNMPFFTGSPKNSSGIIMPVTTGSSLLQSPIISSGKLPRAPNPRSSDENDMRSSGKLFQEHLQSHPVFEPFEIPLFGVTMMGASHGFDAAGRTTGFVLWMNRRGIMVDPPPDSSQILELMGVPPRAIEGVFLTHTHADHDAGTFQRILRTRQIRLYATRTVERSFITKYSAITGFDAAFLRSLFQYMPVQCGEHGTLKFHEGYLKFFYSLHTIPCVGFEAHFGGHSLVYSADTRYDPELVRGMLNDGMIGKARAKQLADFDFDHTVVLHELGVAPIHTPKEALMKAAFDEKHKRKGKPLSDRLFVVHSSKGTGAGFANQCNDWDTIRIAAEQGRDKQISEILSVLENVDWLELLGKDRLVKLAKLCKSRNFEINDIVVDFEGGVPPESIWIVMAGTVVIDAKSNPGGLATLGFGPNELATYVVGDTFGEGGLLFELEVEEKEAGGPSRSAFKRIPGVPLSLEIMNKISSSADALVRKAAVFGDSGTSGVLNVPSTSSTTTSVSMTIEGQSAHTTADETGGVTSAEHGVDVSFEKLAGEKPANVKKKKTATFGSKTLKRMELSADDFPPHSYLALSKVFIVEIPNSAIIKAADKPTLHAVRESLQRVNGWTSDARFQALTKNAPLLKLLNSQLAVREFLANLSEDYVSYANGHVVEDGRGMIAPRSCYFVKEGILRVLPMHAAHSFRSNGPNKIGENQLTPFECGRGSLVGDFNSLIKRSKSPYRIICSEGCELYHLELDNLNKFFDEFPGVKFQCIDRIVIGWMLDLMSPLMDTTDAFGGLVVPFDESKF